MTQYLGGNEMLNTKDNEFNRAAISTIWHERPMLCRDQINVVGNVNIALTEIIALLLYQQ